MVFWASSGRQAGALGTSTTPMFPSRSMTSPPITSGCSSFAAVKAGEYDFVFMGTSLRDLLQGPHRLAGTGPSQVCVSHVRS